jgi:hypothetical protein
MLHPLPSGGAALALRLPLLERDGRLCGRGAATWFAASEWGTCGAPVERAALGTATARGSAVRVAGRPFARGFGPEHAESLARLLRDLASPDPARARERAEQVLAESFSSAGYRAARARVDSATRWLGWCSDLYWLGLFGLLPACLVGFGEERGLLLVLPVLVAFHLAALIALAWSHRSLRPGRIGALIESLAVAACYPPILLREHHALRTQALASFHPAVVAATLLPAEERKAYLRAALVRVSKRAAASARCDSELGLEGLERAALLRLVHELGESAASLLAPPTRRDPLALSFCPACLCEYLRAVGSCSDCDVPLGVYRE